MSRPVHPSDLELAAYADGLLGAVEASDVSAHLDACATCRVRLGSDRGVAAGSLGQVGAPKIEVGLPDGLRSALSNPARPAAEANQLWLARLETQMSAVLIVDAFEDYAVVVPVTFDTEMADEYTLVIDAAESPLDVPLAVWVGLRTVAATTGLEQLLADAAPLQLAERTRSVYGYYIDGVPADDEGVGMPVLELIDPRSEYREQLKRAFALLPPAAASDETQVARQEASSAAEASLEWTDGDVAERVALVIKEFDNQIHQVQDMWGQLIEPSISPLRSARLIDVLGLRIRMCVVPGESSLQAWNPDEASQALDVALLMRDCEMVGVTADNDELETTFVTAWDLHPAHITAGGVRSERRWHPESALPLREALRKQLETYLPPAHTAAAAAPVAPEPIDEVALRNARGAIEQRRQGRPRIEDKRVALQSLDDADAEEVARIVTEAATTGVRSLVERLQTIAGADR